jgi:diaminohydroxyphosphoribosylaminopyrimidine deaminase/5-amino-6-(5-phosphoribosylamino)uracil reductase
MAGHTPEFDDQMMAIALRMAERGLGATAPNPSVGAVIANETTGEVIARATTARGGRPHAETIAIAAAGEKTRGATIYVTLEPCSHQGRTGPCADAIVAAGLGRAVVAIEDPDPRVSGRGINRLSAAGIEVERGVGAARARWITRGHIVRVTERRPFVTLKLALDASGSIARGSGSAPVWVTGEASRAHAMLLRAHSDAILVGSGTVRDDDPELTCRLPGLFDRSPVRVVMGGASDLPAASKLARTANQVPVWVMSASPQNPGGRQELTSLGVEIIDVEVVGGRLWLPSVMESLVGRGLTRLLVEGGPKIWRAFADAAFADEVILYLADRKSGEPHQERDVMETLARWLGPLALTLVERRQLGSDTMWRFHRATAKEGR